MARISNKIPFIIVVVLTIGLIIALMVTSMPRDTMSGVEGFFGRILMPFEKAAYSVSSFFSNLFGSMEENRYVKEEYKRLSELTVEQQNQLIDKDELAAENERLKELLQFKQENPDLIIPGARIIGKNPGNWFNTLVIDRGEKDGVAVDMAVMTDKGLVGRVIEVGNHWSKVLSIIDSQSAVSAIVQRSRDNGTLQGDTTLYDGEGLCRMVYLPQDATVKEGDVVITSGLGDIFPKGLPIGEVVRVENEPFAVYKTAVVRPWADFKRLEEVLVIGDTAELPEQTP